LDVARPRESFARAAMRGDELLLFFCSGLPAGRPYGLDTVSRLAAAGMACERTHIEDLGWSER